MRNPTWLDKLIQAELSKGSDAVAMSRAIAMSPEVIGAIQHGLGNPPGVWSRGPSHAQMIGDELKKALSEVE